MFFTKKCPHCRNRIFKKATICQYCKAKLGEKDKESELEQASELKKANLQTVSSKQNHSTKVELNTEAKPKEKREPFSREEKRYLFVILYWLFISWIIFVLYLTPQKAWGVWIGFVMFMVSLWGHPRAGERVFGEGGKSIQDRVKNYKKHKVRFILSVVAFLFAVLAFVLHLIGDIQDRKEREVKQALFLEEKQGQELIENYPKPEITLLSDQKHQGESLEYELVVEAKEATVVRVGTQTMTQDENDNELFTLTISLPSPETTLELVAKNEYKEATKQLVITRNETEEETQARLEREAQEETERLEAERLAEEKVAEEERLAQEAEAERERLAKEEEVRKAQKEWEREIYKAVNDRMDAIYDEPNRAYLESAVLMDEYDNMQIKEVAQIYGISVEDVEAIYKGGFISEYDDPARVTPSSSSTSGANSKQGYGTGDQKLEAHTCAKIKVESMLKSPKSADFPLASFNDTATYLGYNKYQVESYVDAQNSFGAEIRTNYRCTVQVLENLSCISTCELY